MTRSPRPDRKPIDVRRSETRATIKKKYDPENVLRREPERQADLGMHTSALRQCLQRQD